MFKVDEDESESPTPETYDSEFWAGTEEGEDKNSKYEEYETVDNTTMGTIDDDEKKTVQTLTSSQRRKSGATGTGAKKKR